MDKTLNDLASQYKAKKPALYARLKKIEAGQPDTELYYKSGNIIFLTATGLKLLEADLKANPINTKAKARKRQKQEKEPEQQDSPIYYKELIESYKVQIKRLEQQLETKDRTIERLLAVIEELNKSYRQVLSESHTLTSQQQRIKAIELSQPEQPANNPEQPVKPKRKKSLIARAIVSARIIRGDYDWVL